MQAFSFTKEQIGRFFRRNNMKMVFANNGNLKNILDTTKDKTEIMKISGIYSIKCGDCDELYNG